MTGFPTVRDYIRPNMWPGDLAATRKANRTEIEARVQRLPRRWLRVCDRLEVLLVAEEGQRTAFRAGPLDLLCSESH